jgi:hypothetical protein
MSYNIMIGYDIYDRFTMEHFLAFCSRQYLVPQLSLSLLKLPTRSSRNYEFSKFTLLKYFHIPKYRIVGTINSPQIDSSTRISETK